MNEKSNEIKYIFSEQISVNTFCIEIECMKQKEWGNERRTSSENENRKKKKTKKDREKNGEK